jgi:hypothetical protein|tara:strand:- start:9084 stop:11411 length:2328 start_codon:yes stop_codon:yes gene_type:complete
MATIGNLWINIKANTKGLTKSIGESKNSVSAFGKFMSHPAVLGATAVLAAGKIFMGFAKLVTRSLTTIVRESMKFNQAMAKVSSVTLTTGAGFEAMRQRALDLGRTSVFTADQIAEGQLALAKAGFDAVEVNEAIEASANLAAAADMELAEASGILVNVIRAFRLEAEDTTHVADVLAVVMSRTNTTVEDMGEAFAYVAPVARSLGFTVEQTAAMIGVLADAGVKGSMAGTGLRRVFAEMTEEIGKHGIKALDDYLKSTRTVSDDLLKFGLRGFNITQILTAMRDKMIEVGEASLTLTDVVEKMAEMRMDTLSGDIIKLKSAISGLRITVGDEMEPALREITKLLTHLVNSVTVAFNKWKAKGDEANDSTHGLKNSLQEVLAFLQPTVFGVVLIFDILALKFRLATNAIETAVNGLRLALAMMNGEYGKAGQIIRSMEKDSDDVNNAMDNAFGSRAMSIDDMFTEIREQFDKGFEEVKKDLESNAPKMQDAFVKSLGLTTGAVEQLDADTVAILEKMRVFGEDLEHQWDFHGWEQWEIDAQKALNVLNEMEGESAAIERIWEMIRFKKKLNEIEDMEKAYAKLEDRAESIRKSVMTPLEEFEEGLAEINKLFAEGLLSDETFERARQKLEETLKENTVQVDLGLDAESVKEGLAGAFVESVSTTFGSVKLAGNVDKQMRLAEKTVSIQENMKTLTDAIASNTTSTNDVLNNGTIKTDVDGLQEKITNGIGHATVKTELETEELSDLISTGNDINKVGFNAVVNEIKNISSGNVLT